MTARNSFTFLVCVCVCVLLSGPVHNSVLSVCMVLTGWRGCQLSVPLCIMSENLCDLDVLVSGSVQETCSRPVGAPSPFPPPSSLPPFSSPPPSFSYTHLHTCITSLLKTVSLLQEFSHTCTVPQSLCIWVVRENSKQGFLSCFLYMYI